VKRVSENIITKKNKKAHFFKGVSMSLRKIIALKTTILSAFTAGNVYSSTVDDINGKSTLNFIEMQDISRDVSERIKIINTLDLSSMTESEKESLIIELLESNKKTIELIENTEIDLKDYRDEVGSHSFSM
tara:strand:- start:17572 stop:17964 length:393 start_codon:yes stop_codon:yes gene_type:complete